ncbi:tyrosine-type recombinase/integrase [Aureimonas sp. OT7]|uniref:tyrosine-type recombinase/integrase n=1 Tax=Aureimonas sp. OT7 TaxID=2816454 RepID=UPI001781F737|nr:tyrosine-type recombinase/integrase [Aureimonas sp. OT7]QOG07506.1 tyrosine-type recombinase/integrase [Aureimonas sp. OT7]
MARGKSTDTSFLEKKDGRYRVVVAVPRALHAELGTKLKRPLGTDSLAAANVLKWQVVAELKAIINAALKRGGRDPLAREALAMAAERRRAQTHEDLQALDDAVSIRAEQIAGAFQTVDHPLLGEVEEAVDPSRLRDAQAFTALALGNATPIAHHHSDYLAQLTVKSRTRADDERAIRYLENWCHRNRVAATLQAITRRTATRFMDDMGSVAAGLSNITLQKYINRLSAYWKWLLRREYVEANVWAGLSLPNQSPKHDERERPFTAEEMVKLFAGPAPTALRDVMLIGALTGARLDAVVDLKVKDCADSLFLFKPQKREPAPRAVPIHSALVDLVARRTDGRKPDDDLFPEWPAPKANSLRERSFKTSNAFTAYRREVGVDQVVQGKRRSLVNFHSFRRWFITEAERAGQPEHIIAAVVGHKRQGMTLGRYSAGPAIAQARECVEAVRLPKEKCIETPPVEEAGEAPELSPRSV